MSKTMNDAVEARFGKLTATICEYEVITNQQQARIAELEARLSANDAGQAEAIGADTVDTVGR